MNALQVIAAALLATLLMACGDQTAPANREARQDAPPPVLKFTAIPDQNTTELKEKFQPLAAYLAATLGVAVEYVPSRDYQASVEMFRNGDVLLAWFGGLTGVQARNAVPGASAIAQGEEDPEYYSYFIAHRDSGLASSETFPAAIADLPFTFGSESSTSGRLMPEYFIRQHSGMAPSQFFAHPVGYSGSHDRTVELVESGRFQVGAVNYKVFDRRVIEGATDPDVVRIIWTTPIYADYNWTAHPQLDSMFGADFTRSLRDALLAIDDPKILEAVGRNSFIPASNAEFDGIAAVAKSLGMVR